MKKNRFFWIAAAVIAALVFVGCTDPVNNDSTDDPAQPTVSSVIVSPETVPVEQGKTQQFSAVVVGENSPAQNVTWTVEGGVSGTSITGGLLSVDANETATTLTVRATSTVNTTKSGTATVTVIGAGTPYVSLVTVSPLTVLVEQGKTQQFTENVTAHNNAVETVTWEVEGGVSGTTIADGLLTVDANETATTLTVKATSTVTTTVSGTATVTVVAEGTPYVSLVTVSPDTATVERGKTQQFTENVTAHNNAAETVTWTVEGGVSGTGIDAAGLLTVNANETAATLTVRATSTVTTTVSGMATVTVTAPAGPPELKLAFIAGPSFTDPEPALPDQDDDNVYTFNLISSGNWSTADGFVDAILVYPDRVLRGDFKLKARVQITDAGGLTSTSKGLIIGAFKGNGGNGAFATGAGNTVTTGINLRLNGAVRNYQSRSNDRLAAVGLNTAANLVNKSEEFIYEVIRNSSGITTTMYISKNGEDMYAGSTRLNSTVPYTNSNGVPDIQVDTPVYAGIALAAVAARISQVELWDGDLNGEPVFYSGDSTAAKVPVTGISITVQGDKGTLTTTGTAPGTATNPAQYYVTETAAAGELELEAVITPAYADIATAKFFLSQDHLSDSSITVTEAGVVTIGSGSGVRTATIQVVSDDPIEADYFLTITVTPDYVPIEEFNITGGFDSINVDARTTFSTDIPITVTDPVIVWTNNNNSAVKFWNGTAEVDTVTGPSATVIGKAAAASVIITATATTIDESNVPTTEFATKPIEIKGPISGAILNWVAKAGETLPFSARFYMNPDGSIAAAKSASTLTWIARDTGNATNFAFDAAGGFTMTGRRFNIGTASTDNTGTNGAIDKPTTAGANVDDGELDLTLRTKVTVTYSSASHSTAGTVPKLLLYVNNNTSSGGASPLGSDSRLTSKSYKPAADPEDPDILVSEALETGGGVIYWIIDPADFATNTGKATLENAFIQIRTESNNTITITGITIERAPAASGGTDKMWNFSDAAFKDVLPATWTDTQEIDGLSLIGGGGMAYNTNSKSIDGISFTHRVQLNSAGSITDRTVSFLVSGDCTVTVYGMSGNSTSTRALALFDGTTEQTEDFPGDVIYKKTYTYTGASATLYLYSKDSGINLYGVKVEY